VHRISVLLHPRDGLIRRLPGFEGMHLDRIRTRGLGARFRRSLRRQCHPGRPGWLGRTNRGCCGCLGPGRSRRPGDGSGRSRGGFGGRACRRRRFRTRFGLRSRSGRPRRRIRCHRRAGSGSTHRLCRGPLYDRPAGLLYIHRADPPG
jgi:hypothetical protein